MRLLELKSKSAPWRILVTLIQFTWVAVNNLTAVIGYFSMMTLIYPLKFLDYGRYDEWERWLFFIQFKFCASWGFENNWRIFQSGDFAKLNEHVQTKCILVANHQNTVDISAIMWPLSLLTGLSGAVSWVADAIFKLCTFGWVCMSHKDFFIWQYQDAKAFKWFAPVSPDKIRQVEIKRFGEYVRKYFGVGAQRLRNWLIIFPEGGFKYKRLSNSNKFAEKNKLPKTSYVTYPRHHAVYTATKNAKFEYLIDATIAYESEKEASLAAWWFGRAQKVFIHWRVIKIDQDLTEEQVRDTLYNIWGEKELLLKHRDLYGNFPQLEDKTEINGNLPRLEPAKSVEVPLSEGEVLLYKVLFMGASWCGLMALTSLINLILHLIL